MNNSAKILGAGLLVIILFSHSCKKEEAITLPAVITVKITEITQTTVTAEGNVTDDGGAEVTSKGFCWATSDNPTTADSKTTEGPGTGSFTSILTQLTPDTRFFVRAYAINSAGTAYGDTISCITKPFTIHDVDGNEYSIVKIGTQEWMSKNLKTTRFRNGDLIGTTNPVTLDISDENSPVYQWAYDGDESNAEYYGRLYTWYAVMDERSICPTGWDVPTDAEWTALEQYLITNGFGYGGSGEGIAKSLASTSGWTPNSYESAVGNDQVSNNSSGFNGFPAGGRDGNKFMLIGNHSGWWTHTEKNASEGWERSLLDTYDKVLRGYFPKFYGFSIRCIKHE